MILNSKRTRKLIMAVITAAVILGFPCTSYAAAHNITMENKVASLQAYNPDVVAWITMPGTTIDYPIVQSSDNDYYLHRDIDRNYSYPGSIFMDCTNSRDLSDLNVVIYGHHMASGAGEMFRDLMLYRDEEFFNTHRDLWLYTPDSTRHLKTIGVIYVPSDPLLRVTSFDSREQFNYYVTLVLGGASYIPVNEHIEINQLYSFITCSYEFSDARTILYATEVDIDQ